MQSSTVFPLSPSCSAKLKQPRQEQWDEDEDFEFTFSCSEPYSSPVPADKIFFKGKIKPLYEILSKDFQLEDARLESYDKDFINSRRYHESSRSPAEKFSIEESLPNSCTSSKPDELESVQPPNCCPWTPKACKKDNTTASSRRWRFKAILKRSKSDGGRTGSLISDAGEQESRGEQKIDEEHAFLLCGVLC